MKDDRLGILGERRTRGGLFNWHIDRIRDVLAGMLIGRTNIDEYGTVRDEIDGSLGRKWFQRHGVFFLIEVMGRKCP